MKLTSYLTLSFGITLAVLNGCGEKSDSSYETLISTPVEVNSEPKSKENSTSKESVHVSKENLLEWLPMNHAGFTRDEAPSTDYGDLPRVQVRYRSDSDPAQQFTLDVLDGKGPLVVAVNGMIKANLGEEYYEPLLDGYAKVYQKNGIKAFERHTPADGKAFLHYAIDRRFYFNFQGEQVGPDVFWEFQRILDPNTIP